MVRSLVSTLAGSVPRYIIQPSDGVVAQLVRAPDCRSGGCGFDPRRPRLRKPWFSLENSRVFSFLFMEERESHNLRPLQKIRPEVFGSQLVVLRNNPDGTGREISWLESRHDFGMNDRRNSCRVSLRPTIRRHEPRLTQFI